MKTILVFISFMIFGLYSCGDEVSNTEEKKEEIVRKDKYTIEDILADSNWVEVTDTLHYPNINGFTYLDINWKRNKLIIFKSLEDYQKIETSSDTTYDWYKPNSLKFDIDFSTKTLIGFKTSSNGSAYFKYLIYKNKILQLYQYYIKIFYKNYNLDLRINQNLILIPKIENNFDIRCDTLIFHGE